MADVEHLVSLVEIMVSLVAITPEHYAHSCTLQKTGENSSDGGVNGLRENRRVRSVEVIVNGACKVIRSPNKNKEAVIMDNLERNLKFDENGVKLDDDSEGEVANRRVEIESDSIVEDVNDDNETLVKDGHELQSVNYRKIGSCDVKAVIKDIEHSKLMDQGNLRFRGKQGQMIASVRPRVYSLWKLNRYAQN
ncbi:3893_t:CDS:2 [Gigaspora rosea]|nr:3893_t:CDS:2 [Gigaspora rosea]